MIRLSFLPLAATALVLISGCGRSELKIIETAGRPLEVKTANGPLPIDAIRNAPQVSPDFTEFGILKTPSGWRLTGVTQDKGDVMLEFTSRQKPVEVIVATSSGNPEKRTIELKIVP